MEKLNVKCDTCKVGSLTVLDLVNDNYKMGCDACEYTFSIHYTGFDNIMNTHEYNEQVGLDVRILNECGVWKATYGEEQVRFSGEEFNLDEYTKGMKFIQSISSYETKHYYQDGGRFISISHNQIHDSFTIYKYEANEDSVKSLVNHFFGVES